MVGNWPAKREGQTTNVSPRISFNPQSNTTVQGASSYCKSVQRTWLLGGEIDDVCILETAPLAMIEATTDTGLAPRVLRVILFRFSRIPVPVTRALAQWILIEQE